MQHVFLFRKAQFFGDYPDTKTSEIEIKDASPNVFKVFIEAIYSRTNVIKGMEDCSLLLQLKSLADKFLIKDLVTAATKVGFCINNIFTSLLCNY